MNLIPFTVTIPKEERDENLREKLRKEWPGILQWMIDGCADWRDATAAALNRMGLQPPTGCGT
jgi:putative DNA primase/helicase